MRYRALFVGGVLDGRVEFVSSRSITARRSPTFNPGKHYQDICSSVDPIYHDDYEVSYLGSYYAVFSIKGLSEKDVMDRLLEAYACEEA